MDGDKTSSDLEGVKPEDETPTETEDAPDAGSEDETLIPVITSPQEESSGSGEEAEGPTAVPAQTYVVQQGDTLSSIARQFNTTVEAITAANDIPDPNNIQPGTTLTIPQS
ncbi:MAG: LysM peptidoglycan-binding domain-containing protein [Chloroflexi bacterium]|nr:LysM peptidoglycan-binding domain-containing protein [Chloroflexota bacterium]